MTNEEKEVIDILKNLDIEYNRIEHPPVFTVSEAKRICKIEGTGCKNLFLKTTKNYYLTIIEDSKRADLKGISKQLKISRLSFANEEELANLLGLKQGEVTPFGLIKDIDNEVIVIVDNELEESNFVSFHPNVNTSTLTLKYDDFEKFLEWTGNTIVKSAV